MTKKFIKEGKEYNRTCCEVYSRVMGYYSNISLFNGGKKAEFFGRKNFDLNTSNNSIFIKQYS